MTDDNVSSSPVGGVRSARDEDALRTLLNELHGHLGLAIYRSEGSQDRWKREAEEYRSRIDRAVAALALPEQDGATRLNGFPDSIWPVTDEATPRAGGMNR